MKFLTWNFVCDWRVRNWRNRENQFQGGGGGVILKLHFHFLDISLQHCIALLGASWSKKLKMETSEKKRLSGGERDRKYAAKIKEKDEESWLAKNFGFSGKFRIFTKFRISGEISDFRGNFGF